MRTRQWGFEQHKPIHSRERRHPVTARSIAVNTATPESLQRLPGIGPVTADRIVAEREANGPYVAANELIGRVAGFGGKRARTLTPRLAFALPRVSVRVEEALEPLGEVFDELIDTIRTHHPDLPPVSVGLLRHGHRGHFGAQFIALGGNEPHRIEFKTPPMTRTSASYASRAHDLVMRMLHECAHALAADRGVRDIEANQFHTLAFKEIAEEVGLLVGHHGTKRYGWAATRLTSEAKTRYAAQICSLADALRGLPPETFRLGRAWYRWEGRWSTNCPRRDPKVVAAEKETKWREEMPWYEVSDTTFWTFMAINTAFAIYVYTQGMG